MIANLFDKNIIKIVSFLIISPGSRYTRKELKENTKMNNVPLDLTLNKLKSLKIVEEKNKLYYLNLKNEETKLLLEEINKEYKEFNLPYKIFNILTELAEKLSRIREIKRAILFGSYSKLIYSEKSDIDIAIIFYNNIKNKSRIEQKINKEVSKISKKGKIEIEIHLFEEKDLKNKDPLIKEILRNGKNIL